MRNGGSAFGKRHLLVKVVNLGQEEYFPELGWNREVNRPYAIFA